MPGRRIASAARRVLLLNGPEIWYEIFKHIQGTRILLNLRLVCSQWANQMLYLNKRQFIMFHKSGAKLICDSIFPLIMYLRSEWTKPQILLHIIPKTGKKLLPHYMKKKL